jgi:hypothetical protein
LFNPEPTAKATTARPGGLPSPSTGASPICEATLAHRHTFAAGSGLNDSVMPAATLFNPEPTAKANAVRPDALPSASTGASRNGEGDRCQAPRPGFTFDLIIPQEKRRDHPSLSRPPDSAADGFATVS